MPYTLDYTSVFIRVYFKDVEKTRKMRIMQIDSNAEGAGSEGGHDVQVSLVPEL